MLHAFLENCLHNLFKLLEMGMTASRKLRDLRSAGRGFIFFGLLAPNIFATVGIIVAYSCGYLTHTAFSVLRFPKRARPCRSPRRWD